ncbi:MAG: hypothetical protein AAF337_03540 [Pseudomonadota bacterium]
MRFVTLLFVVFLHACASEGVVAPSRLALGSDMAEVGTTKILKPGDTLLESPVGYAVGARLQAPLDVSLVGQSYALPKGILLEKISVTYGGLRQRLPPDALLFCTQQKQNYLKSLINFTSLGLTSAMQRSGANTRLCLVDTNIDSRMDRAFLLGAKSEKDKALQAIDATPFELVERGAVGPDSYVRIVYLGYVGILGNLGFELQVLENGVALDFDNRRVIAKPSKLPKLLTQLSAQYQVVSFDPSTKVVDVRIVQPIRSGSYGVRQVMR